MSLLPVLVAAVGAAWEPAALGFIAEGPGVVLQKRCVDIEDLLATAATGLAQTCLVSADLPGLDADSVAVLHRSGLSVVAVVADRVSDAGERLRRLGVDRVLAEPDLESLAATLMTSAEQRAPAEPVGQADHPSGRSRLLAVWGAPGAPGRTTVAVGLAAELAGRGTPTVLVDADPYGGSVAQHLGILDEVSGLLVAARAANAGALDRARFAGACREIDDGLRVLTGLPRPDRWVEVRRAAFDQVLSQAADLGRYVVVDAGFCLEEGRADGSSGVTRGLMTVTALERADEVVVVGSPDPVGLSRLARGLVALGDLVPGVSARVVVNRMRSSLGWGEAEIIDMVEGFLRPVGVHFIPDDRLAADRALMAGRSLRELGDSSLRRAMGGLAAAVAGEPQHPRRRGLTLRRAGRAR